MRPALPFGTKPARPGHADKSSVAPQPSTLGHCQGRRANKPGKWATLEVDGLVLYLERLLQRPHLSLSLSKSKATRLFCAGTHLASFSSSGELSTAHEH